jgi:TolB-like protein/tetratricopeptide (TPR) repeat protein
VSGEAAETGRGQPPTDPPLASRAPNASSHVFISYASQDAPVANAVVGALEGHGIKCWIAPRDVVPGALYADEIVHAINEARVVVLILSEHAVGSPHVGKEIERASSKRRRIVTLRTDSASLPGAFEYFLSESQWIEAGSGGLDAAAAKLLEAVRRHLDPSTAIESPPPSPKPPRNGVAALSSRTWMTVGGAAALLLGLGYFVVERLRPPNQVDIVTAPQTHRATAATPAASIAVLPFSDLSAEGNEGYFSDGIAEEILNVLAHVGGLKVASRTSSFQFRKSDLGAPAIAEKLGVRHLLEGSVRKAGDTVRITAQLIDASTDQHEWSESFDRPLSTANLFAVQDEIAQTIVTHLAASLGGTAEIGRPVARRADTTDEGAYDLYLRGRSFFLARSKQNLIAAASALKAAVAKDPKFARAWEMLGAVLVTGKYWGVGDESDNQAGADAIEMALRLDPNLSLAYAVRGEVQMDQVPRRGVAGWEESFQSYSRAIERDGTNATAYSWRGANYAALGYLDRAVQDYQRCLDIDPEYELCRRHISFVYLFLGRADDALRLYEMGLESGYIAGATAVLAPAAVARGDRLGALNILAAVYQAEPQLIRPLFRALTDPTFGERDRQDALALVHRVKTTGYLIPSTLWLLKVYDDKRIGDDLDPPIWWARDDAAWLKSQGRKQAMQYWHLPEYWRNHAFPPQCRPIGQSDFECR